MAIDAHHHFWNPARIPQPWMTADHAAIARPFEPDDLAPLIGAVGITSTVLVQSAPRDDDTDYMFEIAGGVPWVGGIVAWCRLDDRRAAEERLTELATRPKLKGIRHLIHQEPDPHWILRASVQPGIDLVDSLGLVLELPAEYPNHLGDVPELARRHPGLRIVVDHLAKPPLGTARMGHWEALLREAADFPNVYAKISGLNTATPSRDWTASDLEPAVRAAVESFGPDRLMCGSDWPVALLNGDYARVWTETTLAIVRATGSHSEQILAGTAASLYGLEREAATR